VPMPTFPESRKALPFDSCQTLEPLDMAVPSVFMNLSASMVPLTCKSALGSVVPMPTLAPTTLMLSPFLFHNATPSSLHIAISSSLTQ